MKAIKELRIAVCNDHAGYDMKKAIVDHLTLQGVKRVEDFGCHSTESCDYPDYAHPMAAAVEAGEYDFGISICGTGNGISMVANKHAGIRAALCWDVELARLARLHNDANVLSLPGRFVSLEQALEMVDVFFSTEFEGGRHIARIEKIPIKS